MVLVVLLVVLVVLGMVLAVLDVLLEVVLEVLHYLLARKTNKKPTESSQKPSNTYSAVFDDMGFLIHGPPQGVQGRSRTSRTTSKTSRRTSWTTFRVVLRCFKGQTERKT